MKLNYIKNDSTLNIFTDASVKVKNKNIFDVCYGAVAVCRDTIIDEIYRINSNSTVNEGEANGILAGILFALKYRDKFKVVNLFSDSLISVNNLNIGVYKWYTIDGKLCRTNGDPIVKNSSTYLQILNIISRNNLRVNIYHMKGHINPNKTKELYKGITTFIKSNNFIDRDWELDFIKYLSIWNDYVDNRTRITLKVNTKKYINPIKFVPNSETGEIIGKYLLLKEEY